MRNAKEIVDSILTKRGFLSKEERDEFLSDKPQKTYDPYLLPDVEEGMDLLFSSLKAGKNICIYGDYDVDGIMSTVLVSTFLRTITDLGLSDSKIDYYIPSRFDEGYGLNCTAIDFIRERGSELLITVDCGSVSPKEVAFAKGIGLSVIVTDHHKCDPSLLPDSPVINPNREDSSYPCSHLSGCGVAFKTMQAFRLKYYEDNLLLKKCLNNTLDIVAIATVADVVPLIDENRTLVKYGMSFINAKKRLALFKLRERINPTMTGITTYEIGFRIGPHINAAGRLQDANQVVELFLTDDEARMDEIITELINLNIERQRIQVEAEEECIALVEEKYLGDNFLLLRPNSIHEGVSGIVAGKIKNHYNRPTAILSTITDQPDDSNQAEGSNEPDQPNAPNQPGQSDTPEQSDAPGQPNAPNQLKGSCRSISGVNLIDMLRTHGTLFTKLGGHAMAAGFSMPTENEEILRAELNKDLEIMLAENETLFDIDMSYDEGVETDELTLELAELLNLFQPTGTEASYPLFLIQNPSISNIKTIGNDAKHLSFSINNIRCIFFSPDEKSMKIITESEKPKIIAELNINHWNDRDYVQLVIKKVSE